MLNWNTVPMTFNDAWTYLEMLGKLVTQVTNNTEDIESLQSEVASIWENFANYYTKAEADAHFISEDDLLNYYTKEEANARFALATDLIPIQQQINELKTSAALGGTCKLMKINLADANVTITNNKIVFKIGTYTPLETEPDDWETDYTDYYYLDNGVYKRVQSQAMTPAFVAGQFYSFAPERYDTAQVNIMYEMTESDNVTTYSKNISIAMNEGVTAHDFTMYTAAKGGSVTVDTDGSGRFEITIGLPAGTETVAYTSISVILFKQAQNITPELLAEYYARGDIDQDGEITVADAQICQAFSTSLIAQLYSDTNAGFEQFMREQYPEIYAQHEGTWVKPDTDNNGVCNIVDAQMSLMYYSNTHLSHLYEDTPLNFYYYVTGQTDLIH